MNELQKNVNSFLTTTEDYRDIQNNAMKLFTSLITNVSFIVIINFICLETIAKSQWLFDINKQKV